MFNDAVCLIHLNTNILHVLVPMLYLIFSVGSVTPLVLGEGVRNTVRMLSCLCLGDYQ